MSTAKDIAQRAINKIQTSQSATAQRSALTGLINGVNDFVEVVKADAELAKQLGHMKQECDALKSQLSDAELSDSDKRKLQDELKTLESTISQADGARQRVSANRTTLNALWHEVEDLRNSLKKALNK